MRRFWQTLRPVAPPGSRGICSLKREFLGKIYKTKVVALPQFCVDTDWIKSGTSPRNLEASPNARGRSAGMVPWLIGSNHGRTVTPTGRVNRYALDPVLQSQGSPGPNAG